MSRPAGARWPFPALAAAALLAACNTYPPAPPPTPHHPVYTPQRPPAPREEPRQPPAPTAELIPLSQLPGWYAEDYAAAFRAFAAGCGAARAAELAAVCRDAQRQGPLDREAARAFLERHFLARRIGGVGLLTGYFVPEYEARMTREWPFTAAVRPRPTGIEALGPLGDRAAIEATAPEEALAWMKPEDLFFMQIQGSGVLDLPDGRKLKATFAFANDRPFVPIARALRERGDLAADEVSAMGIRAWLAAHRGPQADAVMDLNPRYIFFTIAPDDGREPPGTAGIPLPAGRAIAVDASLHDLGGAYWIDADSPTLAGAATLYRRLVMALDTGGAIKGLVRADLYLGRGEAAGDEAGRVRHDLKLYQLIPTAP